MISLAKISALTSIILTGAIFGFFYAYYVSVMWGLDTSAPIVAIEAMQNINIAVRNPAFVPAFFSTPLILFFTTGCAYFSKLNARWFLYSGLVYLFGAFMPTVLINVPMNEVLAQVDLTIDEKNAEITWQAYSSKWQIWNLIRMLMAGCSLLLSAIGLLKIKQSRE